MTEPTTKSIRKELAILIKSKQENCTTEKEKNHAVTLARQEINIKYGKDWRDKYNEAYKSVTKFIPQGKTENDFYLLDSRAGMKAAYNEGILDTPDNGKYILVVGTLKECCRDANNGTYGEHNVVSDTNYNILWECLNQNGHWSYKLYKKEEEKLKE